MNTFTKNLKQFRLQKHLTQEQAAEALGISAQTVSRWECGTTLPDVTVLPHIARLYGVTIDDLYKEDSLAYDNFAQRLGSIYEATRRADDFLRAEREYQTMIKAGSMRSEDWRLYGILYQYRMEDCRDQALSIFDAVLARGPEEEPEVYWRTRRQRLYLLSQLGKSDEAISEELTALEQDSADPDRWICLIAAYQNADKPQDAEMWMEKALVHFPDNPCLLIYCGNVYAELGKTEAAFRAWERALEIDSSYVDARYSMGFCYEELGQYEKAREVWQSLAEDMERKGFEAEASLPRTREKFCAEKC